MTQSQTIKTIKSKKWETYVSRPGYLQSKQIVLEAETAPVKITPEIVIKIKDDLWVKDINMLSNRRRADAFKCFDDAFKENENWALEIYNKFKQEEKEAGLFIEKIKNPRKINRLEAFGGYRDNLLKIQKYYAIAEVLADFCENGLKKKKSGLLKFAFPYSRLEIENLEDSLRKIKKHKNQDELIKIHLKNFSWVLTGYNIIKAYGEKDVLNEIKGIQKKSPGYKFTGKGQEISLLRSLQIGIYMRNRIKELSQQLWFYIDPVAAYFSKELGISRDDFFQLTFEEALESIEEGKCKVSKNEIRKRDEGFVCGYLNNKEILLTGKKCQELYKHFSKVDGNKINKIKGASASVGIAQGKAKIIINYQDFNKFNKGDILVAPMTTPDYVILMKKAAAFVTDEGGLSCHAAILARELKKPCIIGTKIATKVLRDGDLVEVDADGGVVRILKKE
ncbi:MAG: PEP-utilizing enzyme [Parcubacteria group bacterium]|jgi:phosphoenolpyruvate synthase/pyruvate phosphate dikinase